MPADLSPAFITALAKHLPPSSSRLQLVDIGGRAARLLQSLRQDLDIQITPPHAVLDPSAPATIDSIVSYADDTPPTDAQIAAAFAALRPGGRLIVVIAHGTPEKAWVQTLERHGYIRILVEPALQTPTVQGVLIRGEKPHTTNSTFARIRIAARADGDDLTLETYDGPYVYLLIKQSPNKPVWALRPDERITWEAVTLNPAEQSDPILIAFTSLPKAVSFMQPAVMQGVISNVNKVGKFSRQTAQTWTHAMLLNPVLDRINDQVFGQVSIDPNTAEAPDE